ncbi:MAG: hypothetical protein AAFR61_22705 [Bacteroidota bacterium]
MKRKPHISGVPVLLLLLMGVLAACQADRLRNLSWQSEVLLPIAQTEIGLEQWVEDSDLLQTGSDNVLQLVYRDTLAQTFLADLVTFPDTGLSVSVKLDTLTLSSDTITQALTLADVAYQLIADGNILGYALLQGHGTTVDSIGPITGLSSGNIDIDASDFFQFAELKGGELVLAISNQFPVDIENVILEIRNKNIPGPPIVVDTFLLVPTGATEERSYDLTGQSIESELVGELVNIDVARGDTILIDTTDFVEVKLVAQNLKAKTATAVFPAQTIIDSVRSTLYEFQGEFSDISLTKMVVKSGKMQAQAVSTVEDSILFVYQLESAVGSMGEKPGLNRKLPPAPPGGTSEFSWEEQLGGFTLDLRGQGDGFNTLLERIKVELLYSGNLVTLTDDDSVTVNFGLVDLEPTYVEGYLGQTPFRLEGTAAFDFFERLDVARLRFQRPSAKLIIENSLGLPASLSIRDLTGKNDQNGKEVRLSGSSTVSGPIDLQSPLLPDTSGKAVTYIGFDDENSNLANLLEVLPTTFTYDIELLTNPLGNTEAYDNFGTDGSGFVAMLDFVLPLEGVAEKLILRDTLEVDFSGNAETEVPEALLRLITENPFPMQAQWTARFVDDVGNEVWTLAEDALLEAGIPNAAGLVEQPTKNIFEQTIDESDWEALSMTAKNMIVIFEFDTRPFQEPVSIYTNYKLGLTLVAQLGIGVNESE